MEHVISISSDEEDVGDGRKSAKRIKLDPYKEGNQINGTLNNKVIILDDDEDMRAATKSEQSKSIVNKFESAQKINCVKEIEHKNLNKNNFQIFGVDKTDREKLSTSDIGKQILGRFNAGKTDLEITNSVVMTNDNVKPDDELQISSCEGPQRAPNQDQENLEVKKIELSSDSESQNEINSKLEEKCMPGPSTTVDKVTDTFETCKKMQEFIGVCLDQIGNSETRSLFKSKIPLCKSFFNKVNVEYTNSDEFTKELEEKISLSKKSQFMAVQCFNDVYKLLKAQKKFAGNASTSNVDTKNDKIIKKLEYTLSKLRKKIKQLDQEEIDFDDEEDSCYIKLFRYKERAVKVYEKLCKYRNEDTHYDSIMHNRLDFSGSRFPEINKAINRKFKNNLVFPTYYDIEQCLKKCIDTNNIQMSEATFKAEARNSFEKLGNLIQYRRKVDLLDVHSYYVPSNQDPANDDPELNTILSAHYEAAKKKRDDLCEKYTRLQEIGEDPNLSVDSDDSNMQQSEDETRS